MKKDLLSKEELERLKLQVEIEMLDRPFYRKGGFYKSVFGGIAFLLTFIMSWYTGFIDLNRTANQLKSEILRAEVETLEIRKNKLTENHLSDSIQSLQPDKKAFDFEQKFVENEMLVTHYKKDSLAIIHSLYSKEKLEKWKYKILTMFKVERIINIGLNDLRYSFDEKLDYETIHELVNIYPSVFYIGRYKVKGENQYLSLEKKFKWKQFQIN